MIKSNVSYYTGYLQIQKKGFWKDKSINSCFQLPDTFINYVSNYHDIEGLAPRIESYALISWNDQTKGSFIIGIDPESENKLTGLSKRIINGKYLNKDDHQILIAEGVAKYFNKKIGDTLDIVGQGYHGVNAVNRYKIKGIIHYPIVTMNNSIIYLPLKACQELFGTGGMITNYCMIINPKNMEKIMSSISGKLGDEQFEVMDWKTMLPGLIQTIDLIKFMNLFLYAILYLIVGFGIFGTYYMMINERSYEFGMMIASGMKRGKLQIVTMSEIILLAFIGLVLGFILSFGLIIYLYYNPIILTGSIAESYIKFGIEPILVMPLALKPFLTQSFAIFLLSIGIGTYSIRKINKLDINIAIR